MKEIPLTNGRVAQISDEDYDRVIKFKWRAQKGKTTWYAVTHAPRNRGRAKTIYLHKFILGISEGQEGDHRDRNGLNNQRENLRICTRSQNCFNRSKNSNATHSRYKGVTRAKGKFKTQININGRQVYVGLFQTEEEAARAYDRIAKALHPDFALVNF